MKTLLKCLIFSLPLLFSACVTGSVSFFDLSKNIPPEILTSIQQKAQSPNSPKTLEQKLYSIPIVPIYGGISYIAKGDAKSNEAFSAVDADIILFLIYGDIEVADFDYSGQNHYFSKEHSFLFGLFNHWYGQQEAKPKEKEELGGFSILWGFFKSEHIGNQHKLKIFWIPI